MKYLIALVALSCAAVGIVAFATPGTAVNDRSSFAFPKVQGPPDTSVPQKLRLRTRQDLTTAIGQLAWQQLAAFNAAGAQADRLEMIRTKFPGGYKNLSASSWTITFNTVSQKADGVHVELEIIPTLVADRRPAIIGDGKMKETWVINKNGDRTECRCHARGFDGPVGLDIE